MNRKLIVDAQLFQTPAWHRGMGKYSLELLDSIVGLDKKHGWANIEIILSSMLPKSDNMLSTLTQRLPKAQITYLEMKPNEIGNNAIAKANRKILDAHLDQVNPEMHNTDFLTLSIMQGEICSVFPSAENVNKLTIFYDLIPLMFHVIYLRNPTTRAEYLSKIQELLKADKYLAISKTVANDLTLYLGIDRSRVVSINGGPIDHSRKHQTFKVPKPFILMPTGNDLRKNNRRAILGFEEFNQRYNNIYTLVITSFFKEFEVAELSSLSPNIMFTGNVTGEELSYLYDESEFILFPPEYEGLGLPILEAVQRNKPVACSDISVFREMSETAFNYFNPYSVVEIRDALEQTNHQKTIDNKSYHEILSRYTWTKSVQVILETIPEKAEPRPANSLLPKIAVFGPDPSKVSREGKLMQAAHAELSRLHELEYYIEVESEDDKNEPRIDYLPYISKTQRTFKGSNFRPEDYDAALYHLVDSKSCINTLITALAVPGIAVLHDVNLENLWQAAVQARLIDKSRFTLEQTIEKSIHSSRSGGTKYLASLLANQKAVVVFSETDQKSVEGLAKQLNPDLKIVKSNLPANHLAYDSVLPTKTIEVRQATKETALNVIDFHDYEDLSRTKLIIGSENSGLLSVVEAMNFGVVPCVPKKLASALPGDSIIHDDESDEINNFMRELLQDGEKYKAAARQAFNDARHNHTQLAFARCVRQVVDACQQTVEKA